MLSVFLCIFADMKAVENKLNINQWAEEDRHDGQPIICNSSFPPIKPFKNHVFHNEPLISLISLMNINNKDLKI